MTERNSSPSGNRRSWYCEWFSRIRAAVNGVRPADASPRELERLDAWLRARRKMEIDETRLRGLEHSILAVTATKARMVVNIDALWKPALVLSAAGLVAGVMIGYVVGVQQMSGQSETVASLGAPTFMVGEQGGP